jgi:hypothetical protein
VIAVGLGAGRDLEGTLLGDSVGAGVEGTVVWLPDGAHARAGADGTLVGLHEGAHARKGDLKVRRSIGVDGTSLGAELREGTPPGDFEGLGNTSTGVNASTGVRDGISEGVTAGTSTGAAGRASVGSLRLLQDASTGVSDGTSIGASGGDSVDSP